MDRRRSPQVNQKERSPSSKELLDTPRGRFTPRSEPHQLTAERLTQLCGAGAPFRLLFVAPFRRSLFRDPKTSLSPLAKNHQNNRVSICKAPSRVNSIPLWKNNHAAQDLGVPSATFRITTVTTKPTFGEKTGELTTRLAIRRTPRALDGIPGPASTAMFLCTRYLAPITSDERLFPFQAGTPLRTRYRTTACGSFPIRQLADTEGFPVQRNSPTLLPEVFNREHGCLFVAWCV